MSKQCSEQVRNILSALPARDRELIRAVFFEEKDKDAVWLDFNLRCGIVTACEPTARTQPVGRFDAALPLAKVRSALLLAALACIAEGSTLLMGYTPVVFAEILQPDLHEEVDRSSGLLP